MQSTPGKTSDRILVVATGNPGKLKEMQQLLAETPWELRLKPPGLEIEETGQTFGENARLKASQVAQAVGQWAIADDSGLMVDALGGAPGVYSARYGQEWGDRTDHDRLQRVLQQLADRDDRGAQFVCAIAVARPDGTIVLETEGICRGEITRTPAGTGGFGYDPIFYVPELGQTFASLTPDQKQALSHRGRAFAALLPHLAALP
jgi:XTP/dITP diphosphohydrolase